MSEHCNCHKEETNKYESVLKEYSAAPTQQEISEALKNFDEKTIKNKNSEVLKRLFNSLDLTTLKCTDNAESVLRLTEKINELEETFPELNNVAAICVYPNFANIVSQSLEVESVEIACVSGGFPSSQTFTEVKIAETALALQDGATEIDTVLNIGKFLNLDYESICDEIQEIKEVCGEKKLKVILETGVLNSSENIKKATILSMYSGADFIKTSTGKEEQGATPEAAYVICHTIKEYYEKTGIKIGFKVAGGVNSVNDALLYYTITENILGKEWLNNKLFRIGTSRLANKLLNEITGKKCDFFN